MARAIGNYILCKEQQPEEAGIILTTEYHVVSIGDLVPIDVNIGDKVVFDENGAIPSPFRNLLVIHYDKILAVR